MLDHSRGSFPLAIVLLVLPLAAHADSSATIGQCLTWKNAAKDLPHQYEVALKKYELNQEAKADAEALQAELYAHIADDSWHRKGQGLTVLAGFAKAGASMIGAITNWPLTKVEKYLLDTASDVAFDLKVAQTPLRVVIAKAAAKSGVKYGFEKPVIGYVEDNMKEDIKRTFQSEADREAKQLAMKQGKLLFDGLKSVYDARKTIEATFDALSTHDEQYADYKDTLLRSTRTLEQQIYNYDQAIKREEVTKSAALRAIGTIGVQIRSYCNAGLCDEASRDGRKAYDDGYKEPRELWKKAAEIRLKKPNEIQKFEDKKVKIKNDLDNKRVKVDAKIDELNKKISKLIAERTRVLDELRKGAFCSKCHRTASEIEKAEQISFNTHLGNVKGYPVPAPEWLIAEKAKEYDDKMDALIKEIDDRWKQWQSDEKQLRADYSQTEKDEQAFMDGVEKQLADLEKRAHELALKLDENLRKMEKEVRDCRQQMNG